MSIPAALKATVDQEIADYCGQKLLPHLLDKVRLCASVVRLQGHPGRGFSLRRET
jgi:hypothetical protein